MKWHDLQDISQLDELAKYSHTQPIMIFKHSTRCSVSMMARRTVEAFWKIEDEALKPYFLDLIRHRDISNAIASKFGVSHESPQVLLLKNGEVVYHASHGEIHPDAISAALA